TLRLFEDDTLTPLSFYTYFIEKIHQRIRLLFPNAREIFATSTPVAEDMWPEPKRAMRYNADIRAFNQAAVEVLAPYSVQIDDLYTLMENVPASMHSDQTHFYTPEATERIGNQVCACILDALGEKRLSDTNRPTGDYTPTAISGI
ncbi:MAG: hypothetical protein ACI4RV_00515, partial [Eubacteriales bacterium]